MIAGVVEGVAEMYRGVQGFAQVKIGVPGECKRPTDSSWMYPTSLNVRSSYPDFASEPPHRWHISDIEDLPIHEVVWRASLLPYHTSTASGTILRLQSPFHLPRVPSWLAEVADR